MPRLKALISRDMNIFDCPGLLAVGHIRYVTRTAAPSSGHYRLSIGSAVAGEEFERPLILIIDFDEHGIITEVSSPGKLAL
jgi:hypothetical protein